MPSAADFVKTRQYDQALISPGGSYAAIVFHIDDLRVLSVVDLKTKKTTRSLKFTQNRDIKGVWWASDQRLVFSKEGEFESSLSGELYAIDAVGKQVTYLYGENGNAQTGTHLGGAKVELGSAFVVDPLPSDSEHVLIAMARSANAFELDELDVISASRRRVSTIYASYFRQRSTKYGLNIVVGQVATDGKGRPKYAIGVNVNDEMVELVRNHDTDSWQPVPGSHTDERTKLLGVSADGNTAFLITGEDGCLIARDLITKLARALSCDSPLSTESISLQRAGGEPIVVTYEEGRPRNLFLESTSIEAKAYRSLLKSFQDQRVKVLSSTPDSRKLLVEVSSDRNPGDLYVIDLSTMKADYLLAQQLSINPQVMQAMEPVQFVARDGVRLGGYVTSRSGLKPEKQPLVMLVNSKFYGTGGTDRWEWNPWGQYLASLGYIVMQVNLRDASSARAGTRLWGQQAAEDLSDASQWAVKSGLADPTRICVMGGHYGGYAAVMSAALEPDLYRCVVSWAGAYDLGAQLRTSDIGDTFYGRRKLESLLGTDETRLRDESPAAYVERIKAPLLIAHGTEDERAPFEDAKAFKVGLDRVGTANEWMPFDKEGSDFHSEVDEEKFLIAVKDFLVRYLGSGDNATQAQAVQQAP